MTPSKQTTNTTPTTTPRPPSHRTSHRGRRYCHQSSLVPRGRPATKQVRSKAEFVAASKYADRISEYDKDELGFVCICGRHVSLDNNNWKHNFANHFEKFWPLYKKKRLLTQRITAFFVPAQKYSRPDPKIYCRGLYHKQIKINGKECKLALLGEYAYAKIYYVNTQSKVPPGITSANSSQVMIPPQSSSQASSHSRESSQHDLNK